MRNPEGKVTPYALTDDRAGIEFVEIVPGIVRSSRMIRSRALVGFSQDRMARKHFMLVDPEFTEMFTYRVIAGSDNIEDPRDVLITLSAAKDAHLGRRSGRPVGPRDTFHEVRRARGLRDCWRHRSAPQHCNPRFRLPGRLCEPRWIRSLGMERLHDRGLRRLAADADPDAVGKQVEDLSPSLFPEQIASVRERGLVGSDEDDYRYVLQPLVDVHFDLEARGTYVLKADRTLMETLATIGAIVFALSCVNFTTLTLSRSVNRRMEVGVRKVMGARRTNLVRQFWGEAALTAAVGFLLGVGLTELLLPTFNELASRSLHISDLGVVPVAFVGILLTVFVGAVGGGYPGLILARLQPTVVFAGRYARGDRHRFTGFLITLQYGVSVCLLISTVVILRQLEFVREEGPGLHGRPAGYGQLP